MNDKTDVLAVIRQMQANSCHFRNGLPVLADHHDGERERELAAIAAIAELIEADKEYDEAYAAAVANPAKEAWLADAEERRAAALARVGGA